MNRRIASPARPVSRAISASTISNHTHAPDRVGRAGLLGGGLDELAGLGVAAAVGEGVGLVDEVDGDAPPGQPAGQRGLHSAARRASSAASAWRPTLSRLTARADASSTLARASLWHDDRVEDLQRVGGPTGVGQQQRAASLERAELLGVAHDVARLVQRGERAVEVAPRREAGPGQAAADARRAARR